MNNSSLGRLSYVLTILERELNSTYHIVPLSEWYCVLRTEGKENAMCNDRAAFCVEKIYSGKTSKFEPLSDPHLHKGRP